MPLSFLDLETFYIALGVGYMPLSFNDLEILYIVVLAREMPLSFLDLQIFYITVLARSCRCHCPCMTFDVLIFKSFKLIQNHAYHHHVLSQLLCNKKSKSLLHCITGLQYIRA